MNLLHFFFNLGIALSYLLIPAGLLSIVRRSWGEIPPFFRRSLVQFAAFIVSCAIGHLFEALEAIGLDHHLSVIWHGVTFAISAAVALQMPRVAREAIKFLRAAKRINQELKESEQRFHAFMDNSPAYTWMCDRAGVFHYANRSYPTLLNFASVDEVIGKSIWELFPAEIAEIYARNNEIVFLSGDLLETVEPVYRTDGSLGKFLIHKFLIKPDLLGGKALDITDREQLREEVERINLELEQFAYAASHDLRTPLRGIAGLLAILSKKLEGRLDEQEQRIWEQIQKDCDYAAELVNGILEYSRIGRLQEEFEPIELCQLIKEVCDRLADVIKENEATVVLPLAEVEIRGDRTQIAQVLQNLIGNAIKYRSAESPVITIVCQEEPKQWILSIQDNGMGIDPEYQEQLFTMFRRLHSRSEIEGTGIGLAICKKIAQRHGGDAWVSSGGIGLGSTFYISVSK